MSRRGGDGGRGTDRMDDEREGKKYSTDEETSKNRKSMLFAIFHGKSEKEAKCHSTLQRQASETAPGK